MVEWFQLNFFGTMTKDELSKNEYVVTNQWSYPSEEGGKD
jgi:type I restriction enzyme R subunit